MAKWEISESDFEKEFIEATARAELNFKNEPKIDKVYYKSDIDSIIITLLNRVCVSIPRNLISELSGANEKQIKNVTINPLRDTLIWDSIDVHISLKGLLIEYFQLLNWMGPVIAGKNGQIKSAAKAEASRLNGKRGGRPPKVKKEAFLLE